MWLYRTSGDAAHPIVLYEYQPGKESKYPQAFLKGFHGYLQTDGAAYYNQVEAVTHIRPSFVRVNDSPSMEVDISFSASTSESSAASSDSNMDCVGGAIAGDSSGWESNSVSAADSAVLGSLSARTLGRRPMTIANTSRRAKRHLWIFTFV